MTETRWRDIAMALVNRVHDQQVTITIEEIEKARETNNSMFIGEGKITVKADGWPDASNLEPFYK